MKSCGFMMKKDGKYDMMNTKKYACQCKEVKHHRQRYKAEQMVRILNIRNTTV